MRPFILIINLVFIFSYKSISQGKDILVVLDFDNKTIDTIGDYIYLHSVWDSENVKIVADPDDITNLNKVFMWNKNPEGQAWGGFIFTMYDESGINMSTWEYVKFRMRSTKPFKGVTVKLQKPQEIGVFFGEKSFAGQANTWYDIEIKLTDIVLPHNNPSYFMVFPGGGETNHADFYFDDLRFERPLLIPVSSITFNNTTLQLRKGEILQLSPIIEPLDATNLNLAKWKSDNEDVVLVSSKGLIAVVGKGEAIVRVEVGGIETAIKIISD